MNYSNRWSWMTITLITAGLLSGCAKTGQQERDALLRENQELRDALSSTRQAMEASDSQRYSLQQRIGRLESDLAAKPVVTEPPPPAPGRSGFADIPEVETIAERGRITVRIPGDILFDSGKAVLKTSAKTTLTKIAQVIKNEYADKAIRVEGHTDTDPIRKSRWTDNLELSLQRAAAVHRYLDKQGVGPKKMYAAGYGQWHPRPTKAKSRRVEIVVVLTQ